MVGDYRVSVASSSFRRRLSKDFLKALDHLINVPEGQWWRDVLAHPDLILAVRDDYLNVYYRGGSIFRIVYRDGEIIPESHVKYLVRQKQAYATLRPDASFNINPKELFWQAYQGRTTLNEMIAAASALAGSEKTGLHALVKANPKVIDVEVAFASPAANRDESDEAVIGSADDLDVLTDPNEEAATQKGPAWRQDRLDAATLAERDGDFWIVFHEAKHFANKELRAGNGRTPPVVDQIIRYRRSLEQYAPDISRSYIELCQALVGLDNMRAKVLGSDKAGLSTLLDPLIAKAATATALRVDPEPRLIVFGFDKDQRDGPVWQHHYGRLTKEFGLTVHAIGNPKNGGAAAFGR
jgi:hypothetical protein